MIYAAPTYAMGADADVADTKAKAERELHRMIGSLKGWLKYRGINNEVAAGKRKARIPASIAAKMLVRNRDWQLEQDLASHLYLLLSEIYDPQQLPSPDVSADPDAAAKLARIVIAGKLPDPSGAQPQGIAPLVIIPLVIGGVILLGFSTYIKSKADEAKERERLQCIRDGACTDYGFWLKAGAVVFLGWFAWEKMGLKNKVKF
jgi:hypothetical protein